MIISISGELDDSKSEEDPFGVKEKKPEVIEPRANLLFQAINPFLQTKIVAELIQSIQPDKWYNIPVPLVESTKAICEIIKILEKRFYEVTKQTNDR